MSFGAGRLHDTNDACERATRSLNSQSASLAPFRGLTPLNANTVFSHTASSAAAEIGAALAPVVAEAVVEAAAQPVKAAVAQSATSAVQSAAAQAAAGAIASAANALVNAAAAVPSPLPSMASILQSATNAASAAVAAATPTALSPSAPGISPSRRMLRALAKEAFAYMAAPLFMPVAFSRALFQPDGLSQDDAVLRRFGRYLANRLTRPSRNSAAQQQLNEGFLNMLTKNRRNILLTMKQFRDAQRKATSDKRH